MNTIALKDSRFRVAYGAAHYGKSLFWYVSELLFAYFLTELCHLPPALMGWTLTTGLVSSALIDIAAGQTLKRRLSSGRTAINLQFLGSLACTGSLLIVILGAWTPQWARFSYAIAAGVLFRCCYALYDLPQNALLSLFPVGPQERSNLSSVRLAASGIASLTIAAAVAPLLSGKGASDQAGRFMILAVCLSAVAALTSWNLSRRSAQLWVTRPTIDGETPIPRTSKLLPSPPVNMFVLLAAMFVINLAGPIFGRLEPYFTQYVLHAPALGGAIMMSVALGSAAAQPLWSRVATYRSFGSMLSIAGTMTLFCSSGFYLFQNAGVPFAMILAFGFGAATGGSGMIIWAAFGEMVHQNLQGQEGLAYGLFTATAKLALAVGGLSIAALLGTNDYRGHNSGVLTLAMCFAPAFAGLVTVILGFLLSRRS